MLPEGPSVFRYKETRETRNMQWKIEISYSPLLTTYLQASYHVKGFLSNIQIDGINLYQINADRN